METPGLLLAFFAGLLSFFSPCVLAVAPGYLAMLAGSLPAGEEKSSEDQTRRRAVAATAFFILGFTVVFILLGTAVSALGQALYSFRGIFLRLGGILLIFLGLSQWGAFRIFLLQREFRFHPRKTMVGPVGWMLTGATFAFGWTPCVGPILGMILVVAGSAESMITGVFLLTFYSVGMALPFFLLALAFQRFYAWYKKFLPYTWIVTLISGLLLITIGLLLFFDRFAYISSFLNRLFGGWSPEELFIKD